MVKVANSNNGCYNICMELNRIRKSILCTFSDNVRKERLKKGYTQSVLAALAEVDTETIRNYELGKNFPTFPNLVKLLYALEIEPNELLCEKRELTPEERLSFNLKPEKKLVIPSEKKRKRIRFKKGEEPDVKETMKDVILQNKILVERLQNKKKRRKSSIVPSQK